MLNYTPHNVLFDRAAGTLLLDIDEKDFEGHLLALQDQAKHGRLQRKSEFHITIIGFRTGKGIKELLAKLKAEDRKKRLLAIERLAIELDWKFSTEGQKIYFLEKKYADTDTRQSIIQMLDMPDMLVFYKRLNSLLRSNFVTPPPHITLFVEGTDPEKSAMGIGIDSLDILKALRPEELSI